MATTFMKTCQAAAVTTFNANADLMAIVTKCEGGIFDPLASQELLSSDLPYVGVVVTGAGKDDESETRSIVTRLSFRCAIATIASKQQDAQNRALDIISQLKLIVMIERCGERFSVADGAGSEIEVVYDGDGQIVDVGSDEDNTSFIVFAEFNFEADYRLVVPA